MCSLSMCVSVLAQVHLCLLAWISPSELLPCCYAPSAHQIPTKVSTALPLEFFDSPEMEVADRPALLREAQAGGADGLAARSRFYDPGGAFAWEECTAVEYDG